MKDSSFEFAGWFFCFNTFNTIRHEIFKSQTHELGEKRYDVLAESVMIIGLKCEIGSEAQIKETVLGAVLHFALTKLELELANFLLKT